MAKRKPGRPPKPEADRKEKVVTIALKRREREALEELAEAIGKSTGKAPPPVATLVRELLLESPRLRRLLP